MLAYETRPYRPCVGIMLINGQGKIFAGQRIDNRAEAWQMPQGGIDEAEAEPELISTTTGRPFVISPGRA